MTNIIMTTEQAEKVKAGLELAKLCTANDTHHDTLDEALAILDNAQELVVAGWRTEFLNRNEIVLYAIKETK